MSEEQKKQIGKAHNIKLKKKPVSENMELFYQQSENIFGAYARDLVKLGWSVFPQDAEGRRPGRVFGETIRWAEGHHLKEKLPTKEALDLWCGHCATLNVACVFGPASNNTFAVDIDVTNREMSDAIVEIAENILGPTPFMREGRAPKIAMIYRHSDEEAELIPNISRRFAQKDDTEKSDDGLELLGSGKLITFLGKHHKTGQYFKWLDASPLTMGSDKAPLVTQEQVRKFMEAVDEKFPFHRGSSFEFDHSIDAEDMVGLKAKNILSKRGEGLPWTDDQDGKIIDGREAYLTSLVFSTVRDNINTLNQAMAKGDAEVRSFKAELTLVISEQFEATAAMTDRWRKSYVRSQTKEKVHRLVESVVSGRTQIVQKTGNSYLDKELILPQRPSFPKDRATTISRESSSEDFLEAVVAENYEEFDFLKPNHIGAGGRGRITGELEDPIPGEGSFDIQDRKPISDMVQKGLQEAFTSFLGDVYGDPDGYNLQERKTRVHILKAPTGAGKTSSCIKRIAQDPRTYEDFEWKDQASGKTEIIRAPFVMLLPTYHNIDELRSRAQVLNLDGSLPDDELRIKATEAGLISEDELDAKLAELRRDALNSGLSTMVYSGKIKAGCMVADKVQLAMAVGIGTSPFCETLKFNKDTEKNEIEYCEFYNMCPAIAQRQEIQKQHIVFMPHSFLSLSIPPELNKVRAIIADERIHHLFLHTATFSATSLMITRKPPRLTAREKHDGVMAEELLADRNALSKIVLSALRKGECPAEALVEYRADNTPEGINPYIGGTLVQSALRVCSSAIQRDGKIVPSMSIDDVRELCNTPTGKDIREEFQFWSIIQERIALLRMDRLRNEGTRILERQLITTKDVEQRNFIMEEIRQNKAIPDKACGEKDYRLQLLTDQGINGGIQESIRISWRTKPNWNDIPLLLLDASAAPPIIAKIWHMKEEDIVVHDIVADTGLALNLKIVGVVNQTFSNSSLVASPTSTRLEKMQAAKNLSKVRQAISTISSLYGDGRVVCGTSIALRELINNGWACPDNVDWCHYGAMRGLDGFKFHAAALSVGRMEIPIRVIDALVAALTYDDIEPEKPIDLHGTGMDILDVSKSLRLEPGPQRLRLRSGYRVVLPVPMVKEKWGRLIQRQYREEELMQFVGRLRPVYREGRPPVWFALSSVIPEELIIDDLINIDDLLFRKWPLLWESVRRLEGVLHPDLIETACSDLFPKIETAVKLMKQAGFKETPPNVGRYTRGFSTLSWSDQDGKTRFAFIRRSIADKEAHFRRIVEKHLGYTPENIKEIPHHEELHNLLSLARERKEDNVDKKIGDKHARIEMEKQRFMKTAVNIFRNATAIDNLSTLKVRMSADADSDPMMSFAELESLETIETFWNNKNIIIANEQSH